MGTQSLKSGLKQARRLANVYRFVDDLAAINDGSEFERTYKEIYQKIQEALRVHFWTFYQHRRQQILYESF